MNCPRCQRENRPDAMFCDGCGSPVDAESLNPSPAASYEDLRAALTAAVEQQTATAEILRVISRSQTDVRPVFDAIVRSAVRLCGASHGGVYRFDGTLVHSAAHDGYTPEQLEQWLKTWPRRVTTDTSLACEAIRTRSVVQIGDIEAPATVALTPAMRANLRSRGTRSVLSVPMVGQGTVIGAISLTHPGVDAFSDTHVRLLQAFADQAVIAIENVRLFNETKEALERQTAMGEILRIISSSPTDTAPVFRAIIERATRLVGAQLGIVWVYLGGSLFQGVAAAGANASAFTASRAPRRFGPPFFRERGPWRPTQIPDVRETKAHRQEDEYWRQVDDEGMRTLLLVPLLQEQRLIGSIGIYRREVRPFSEQQIDLVRTFASQAVIAIENVRLFTELQASNRELRAALETQTATGDILRVISQSQTDVQPVFDAIVASAARLCEADYSAVARFEGGLLHLAAVNNMSAAETAAYHSVFPRAPGRHFAMGRAFVDRQTAHIEDIETDPDYDPRTREVLQRAAVYRTFLGVPIVLSGVAIGAIGCGRHEMKPFTTAQIELVKTFADQAVIAIENVRLFAELEARNRELGTALDRQTATSEILRVISSLPIELQPVFDALAHSARRLLGGHSATVRRLMGDEMRLLAFTATASEARPTASRRVSYDRDVVDERRPVVIEDTETDARVSAGTRARMRARGLRSLVVVPMFHGEVVLGAITVTRSDPGPFSRDEIALLQTFADQAVIAVENVRLFKELEAANRELKTASQHKSEFLANMSHELRTPLNAIIGFSEVLAERMFGELNEKQGEYLGDIHTSGQHLLSLINDILDLSKIEAGRMELEVTDVDLPATIDNALTLVRERAGRHGIALHHEVDARLGPIRGDERKLKQVLLNLLSNAIKFTPEGGRIAVRAALLDGMAEVAVADTGVGIAPEDQEAVFEEFRQVGTADKKVEGTGLGLTLSRKFVELHGGRIWVESRVGAGSTFTFAIPIGR